MVVVVSLEILLKLKIHLQTNSLTNLLANPQVEVDKVNTVVLLVGLNH
jgi:hypothetical protein